MTASSFAAALSDKAAATEALLERLLADDVRAGELARPPRLLAAMRHAVLGGGKRLRPFLAVETARLLGRAGEGPLRAGAAVELLHGYSLVHDDLPCMDDDDLRRGKPTVHRAFDEATAILAGDALQTLAFEVLADPATDADGSVRSELVLGLARAAGLGGMVGGQMLDLAAEGRYGLADLDEAGVRRLQAMKTGAILAFSVEAGAIIGRADAAAAGAASSATGGRSARPSRWPTTSSTARLPATRSASAPARTGRRARRPSSTCSASTAPMRNAAASSPRPKPPWRITGPRPIFCARRPASRPSARLEDLVIPGGRAARGKGGSRSAVFARKFWIPFPFASLRPGMTTA